MKNNSVQKQEESISLSIQKSQIQDLLQVENLRAPKVLL